jgi:hypothetical protein
MDQRIAVVVVLRPCRRPCPVGISRLGEIRPVGHHLVAQLAVVRADVPSGARFERAENILDVVGVKRKRAGVELARRCSDVVGTAIGL